jgi:antitoxin HicB
MKAADDYLKLPYHIRMVRDEDAAGEVAWVASVAELPGCLSQGDAPEEAAALIYEAMRAWMETTLALGKAIPVPRSGAGYSGKFQVRLPAGLHEAVALEAEHEGVSLNAYVSTVLAGAVGWKSERRSRGGEHTRLRTAE